MYALFFTEIVTTNVLQLLDIGGHVNRHIIAPRARNQDAMNLAMQGSVVELAERFTNMVRQKQLKPPISPFVLYSHHA